MMLSKMITTAAACLAPAFTEPSVLRTPTDGKAVVSWSPSPAGEAHFQAIGWGPPPAPEPAREQVQALSECAKIVLVQLGMVPGLYPSELATACDLSLDEVADALDELLVLGMVGRNPPRS